MRKAPRLSSIRRKPGKPAVEVDAVVAAAAVAEAADSESGTPMKPHDWFADEATGLRK